MVSKQKKATITLLKFRFTKELFAVDDSNYKGIFRASPVQALYILGFEEKPTSLDEAGIFLYRIAETFLTELSKTEGLELLRENIKVSLSQDLAEKLLLQLPFASGSEFVNDQWLSSLWQKLLNCFSSDIKSYKGSVAIYLAEKSQHLKVAEKIFFHLVENKKDANFPFSFLATYSTSNSDGSIRHAPLSYALTEYKNDRDKMLSLLACLNKAGDSCTLISDFIESGEMFHPLRLTADEAFIILKAIPSIEEGGIVCRIPDWWKKKRQKVKMGVKLEKKKSLLGLQTILSMDGYLEVDGVRLSPEEIKQLLSVSEGLALIKGKWIEVDHDRLNKLLAELEKYKGDISMLDALKQNFAGSGNSKEEDESLNAISNSDWISSLLRDIRGTSKQNFTLPQSFCASLRPYQTAGYEWLMHITQSGFGACLADDMGLGKTIQVLAFLESLRAQNPKAKVLLVVPSSLLGNWQKECSKFTPQLHFSVLHASAGKKELLANKQSDLNFCITTYSMVGKIEELLSAQWDALILDEAQAIKNPSAKQTKVIKSLDAKTKIALTGTPVENDLTNLWSLFDFLNKGLLGSASEFKKFCKNLSESPQGYSKLKSMINPFMLRRLKTDKTIISDLPEKMEIRDYVALTAKQKTLYKKYVENLAKEIEHLKNSDEPMKRRGIVLSSLLKLKQICNHPDQYTGSETFAEKDSGKFSMLRDMCQTIYEKRERVLIFTQFKEITSALDKFLTDVFGIKGFVLHGGTSVAKRNKMVEEFQSDKYIPYMVISVKAGGTGLNLTNANHVIHFDRWWNPAVENQATDRAFRIGQTKDVMVHKFVCTGTIEEKIDELIRDKTKLAENVISPQSGESWITEMADDELLKLFSLEA